MTDRDRIAALEANNKFLREYRDGLVDRIKELEKEVDKLTAYNRKLLDENLVMLNERNEARRKAGACFWNNDGGCWATGCGKVIVTE